MRNFFAGVMAEAKQVQWPTRKELITLVIFTVLVCAIIAVLMLGLDVFFLEIRDTLLSL